ncbi:sigma-70 family RNA polymerase sigma factor [Streptomyces sp. HNM0575]|uniref:sigma-70 family RNA polymerase sigma factor n=1 Tax=Streptomyces sp. HNM0575 TaxID=2716338 RepID=UPI00145D6AA1|nr:sigma-70 family RNA polymerase sigma factor [Streptomyces sp. HNM0575]NLU74257.1 sigma-70 family RNA polymerase sigma factor [Streptomyces sp. HNM0575]
MANETPQRWDRRMQQRLARGEAAALGELYDRFASLVHSLAHRVLDDETATDHATREVFGHIWEHPHDYDPKKGLMRSWIADITQEIATERLRRRHRAEGTGQADSRAESQPDSQAESQSSPPGPGPADGTAPPDGAEPAERREQLEAIEEKVRAASTAARADYIVTSMPSSLRAALELTYFQRRDYRQTARQLGVTEDEARRRLRLGLQLLSSATRRTEPVRPSGHGHTR